MAFHNVVKQLETELGPDTGDLGIRVGLHSGPVTAGVLRGERSRFQLFGGAYHHSMTSRHDEASICEVSLYSSRYHFSHAFSSPPNTTRYDEYVLPH
jgi:Adenylate and Guanylate cyclase catalytic domain